MKGKGTRGMPGKGMKPPEGSGFNKKSKERMQKRDFARSEWTLVAEKGDLGEEVGSTLAVEAGMSPQGQNYIWTLIRVEDGAGAGAFGSDDDDESNVIATDGQCRACSFPLTKSTVTKEADGTWAAECASCGSKFAVERGEVIDWLPGGNPVQWMAKQVNSKKEALAQSLLKTRVSKSGRVYLRLPDGTLPIEKSAADRAAELAAPLTAQEQVAAAQAKAAQK